MAETPEPIAQHPSSYRKRPQASAGTAAAAECQALLAHASVAILPPYARQHRFPQGLCPGHAPATAGGGGPQARSAAPSLDRRHPGHLCPPDRGSARAGSHRPAGPARTGALSRSRGRALRLAGAGQLWRRSGLLSAPARSHPVARAFQLPFTRGLLCHLGP